MNKLWTLIIPIIVISCYAEPILLKNGLTKEASEVTEYLIEVEKDSTGNEIQDTLVIRDKKYNDNDQIISLTMQYLYRDECMEIEYLYNDNNKIEKEVVNLTSENRKFNVDYFYKDTLLFKTMSKSMDEEFQFTQIGEYEFHDDNSLKQSSLLTQGIELETKDTITNTLEISIYDKKELVTESRLLNFKTPERNRITKYEYNGGTLTTMLEFNDKDSLISRTDYKYSFDKYKNWIEKKSIKNGQLDFIIRRKIKYK